MTDPNDLISPKQAADIVVMLSNGDITKETAREVMEWCIRENHRQRTEPAWQISYESP